ncbi:MAG: hypothetical protein R2758_07695 [Bacteroidales bacterium]
MADSIILYQNGTQLKKVTETTLSHTITATGSGSFKLLVKAWHNNVMKADSVYYFIRTPTVTEAVSGRSETWCEHYRRQFGGILLYAPYKSSVFVMGRLQQLGPRQ